MATTITFNDGSAATLSNGKTAPLDRFANWVPISRPVGDFAERQSDGAITRYRLRTNFAASFELRMIPVKTSGGVRLVDVADRLIQHLLNGGTCSVTTGDNDGSTYATCGLLPGTEPGLSLTNPRVLEYTLSLQLLNLAGSPVRMVCHYAA